ncbi:MAG: serine hydrolase [Bacteroidota bacterium]
MKKRSIVLLLLTIVFNICSAQISNSIVKDLDLYFQASLNEWKVPGMAIAIVRNDSILLLKGYGVKNVETKEKVDENTLFAIASNSKTFTASALAKLVQENKLSWNDPVTKYLPYFELYNPYVSSEMKIRDLLCHRSGLATFSGDLLWYGSNYSREDIVRRAKYLKPTYGFREKFGYSNIMFLAAGLVIEKVTGMTWDNYIKKEFLTPLNMTNTITSTKDISKNSNIASPHTEYNDKIIPIELLNWDNIAPAGSIISSASDMSNWLRMQLNKGKFNDKQILLPETQMQMWQAQTTQDISKNSANLFPSTHFKAYGLGWSMFDYHGRKIIGHNGGYDGMISQSIIIPEENLGFVILTNMNSTLYYPLMYKVLDAFLCPTCKENKDWSKYFLSTINKQKEADKKEIENAHKNKIVNTKPSLNLEAYTGRYTSKLYGDAEVKIENNQLSIQFIPAPMFKASTKHSHYDTFEIEFTQFPSLPKGSATFILNKDAKVEQMKIDVPNPDFDFGELEFFKQ